MASPRARNLRKNLTEAEQRLWSALRRKQLDGARFRRQVPVGPYVADFACLAAKLVVELDGGRHALETARDVRRDAWFAERGYRTLRFWNNDVLRNLDGVLAAISAALGSPPHPNPPPQGGRE
jgi:very-short-patch-repair endonuclease